MVSVSTLTPPQAKGRILWAPTFVTDDGELFWGDDRFELALAHAKLRS